MGFTTTVTNKCDGKEVQDHGNMPSLHVFKSLDMPVIVISTTPGVLIREIRIQIKDRKAVIQSPMVDSIFMYYSDFTTMIPRHDREDFVAAYLPHNLVSNNPHIQLAIARTPARGTRPLTNTTRNPRKSYILGLMATFPSCKMISIPYYTMFDLYPNLYIEP